MWGGGTLLQRDVPQGRFFCNKKTRNMDPFLAGKSQNINLNIDPYIYIPGIETKVHTKYPNIYHGIETKGLVLFD